MKEQHMRLKKKDMNDRYPYHALKRWLEYYRFSQSQLAKLMHRPEKTLSEIMTGKTAITAQTAIEICTATAIPCEYLLKLQNRLDLDRAQDKK